MGGFANGRRSRSKWHNVAGIVPVNSKTLAKVSSDPVRGKDGKPALTLDAKELADAYYVDYSYYDAKKWNEEFNGIFFK